MGCKPYGFIISSPYRGRICSGCLRAVELRHLCTACREAAFCSEACRQEQGHGDECGVYQRLVLTAKLHRADSELAKLVASILARRMAEVERDGEESREFQTVRGLSAMYSATGERPGYMYRVAKTVRVLLEPAALARFPGEALVELIDKVDTNCFGIWSPGDRSMGRALYPLSSLFNHSCGPNLVRVQQGRLLSLRLLYDVCEGEELNITYIEWNHPRDYRQKMLQGWNFDCTCPRCELMPPPSGLVDALKLVDASDYGINDDWEELYYGLTCDRPSCCGFLFEADWAVAGKNGRPSITVCSTCRRATVRTPYALSPCAPSSKTKRTWTEVPLTSVDLSDRFLVLSAETDISIYLASLIVALNSISIDSPSPNTLRISVDVPSHTLFRHISSFFVREFSSLHTFKVKHGDLL